MSGFEQTADQPVGELMELRQAGECSGFHIPSGEFRLDEIRRTLVTQRIDTIFLHLQVKE